MKLLTRTVLVAFALVLAGLPGRGLSAGPPERVPICHLDSDTGTYARREVPNNRAFDAHLAHGDHLEGDAVPNTAGYVFDANCNAVPDPVSTADSDGDGVTDDEDNCVDVPNADQSQRYGSPLGDACETDADGDGVPNDVDPHWCLSIDGFLDPGSTGSASCSTDAAPAGGAPNIAVADEGGTSTAGVGANNTAQAGVGSVARAFSGDGNSAIALAGATAEAAGGDSNTATASGPGAVAGAGSGSDNTAVAEDAGSRAFATTGDRNYAKATGGGYACAGGGGSDETALNVDLCG